MSAAIALPRAPTAALPAAPGTEPARLAKHHSKAAHDPGFARLLTLAEARSTGRNGGAAAARATPGKAESGAPAPVSAAPLPAVRPAGAATNTKPPAGTPAQAAASASSARPAPPKPAGDKSEAHAAPPANEAALPVPPAASVPQPENTPVPAAAAGGGGQPREEAGPSQPADEPTPAVASADSAPPAAAPEQANAAPAQSAASAVAPAEAVPPGVASAGEAAAAAVPDPVISNHDPAAQAALPAPAGQDGALSASGQAALAEARETVALRVAHAAQNGVQTVSIDLHPAELGHVAIELSFHGGGVSVQISLARHETYAAFARDRATLEQQLTQSGLTLGSGGLDLRFGQKQDRQPAFAGTQAAARVPVAQPAAPAAGPPAPPRRASGRLNIIA